MRILLVLACLLPLPVAAQTFEFFATAGAVQLWDDESSLGVGATIGGGGGFRSPHGWGVEALVDGQSPKRRFSSGVRFDSTAIAARARLLKYFGTARGQAYAGAGLGVSRIKSSYEYGRDVARRTSSSGILSGFGGVRIVIGERLFVRPEFEVSRAGEHLRIGGTVAVGAGW
jgi:hypothetical protein